MITIGREFGSGGHKIGQLLADKMQLPYYDNELITLAARRGALDEEKLAKYDEKKHNPYIYEVNYGGNEHVRRGISLQDALYELQRDVILEIGARQDAIIVGRCADDVLKKAEIQTVSVFIAAPFEARVKRTMEINDLDEKTVVSMTKKKDKGRKQYYESRTGKPWGKPENYDLYFDTSESSFDEIADQITAAYLEKKNV